MVIPPEEVKSFRVTLRERLMRALRIAGTVDQLRARVGGSSGGVFSELQRMTKMGLVRRSRTGKLAVYSLNRK